ncbi:MAG: hypothetical protein WC969_11775 [Elusimicrobiota bacterium]|jgi:hypothetical protein
MRAVAGHSAPRAARAENCLRAALLLACALGAAPPRAQAAEPAFSPAEIRKLLTAPAAKLAHYQFDARRPLADRVGVCPYFLLKTLREMDGRPDYKAYTLTPAERTLFLGYLEGLPAGMRRTFTEGLVGVYFVKGLMGNGLTSWVYDGSSARHAYIVLNPAGFERPLSETLREREASVFTGKLPLRVETGSGDERGILYSLLHEGAHACDYIRGLTPWVEPFIVHAFPEGRSLKDSWDVWARHDRPRPDADFPLRKDLRFYGFSPPLIAPSQAPRLYRGFAGSPFASLYGSRTWAEDAAELVVFQHLTGKLRLPYAIVVGEGKEALRIEPMRSPKVRRRAARLYRLLEQP